VRRASGYDGDPNNGPKTRDKWFDTSVFSVVPAGEFRNGNERRGGIYGPGLFRTDLSLFKTSIYRESRSGNSALKRLTLSTTPIWTESLGCNSYEQRQFRESDSGP